MQRQLLRPSLVALAGILLVGPQIHAEYADNFESYTPDATGTDAGWSSADSSSISSSAGYGPSQGFSIPGTTSSPYITLGSEGVTNTTGDFVFRAKVLLNPDKSDPTSTRNEIFLHEASSGTNGFLVAKFNGTSSRSIAVSTGHTTNGTSNWGSQGQAAVDGASWESNIWYQVDFTGTLSDTGDGTASTGVLNMWEVDTPANQIISNQDVVGFGSGAGAFNIVDRIQFRSWSVGSTVAEWQFDDVILTMAGDLNVDGFVGLSDLNLILGNWNQNVPVGDWQSGDASNDGFVGLSDLNVVLGNWNSGEAPTVAQVLAAVPEPTTLSILALGIAGALRRRNRLIVRS